MIKLVSNVFRLLTSVRDSRGMLGKSTFRSKTVWANFFVVLGIVGSKYLGFELTGEDTAYLMGAVNVVLRHVSNEPVGFIDFKE